MIDLCDLLGIANRRYTLLRFTIRVRILGRVGEWDYRRRRGRGSGSRDGSGIKDGELSVIHMYAPFKRW
jgi:hypothetical protein